MTFFDLNLKSLKLAELLSPISSFQQDFIEGVGFSIETLGRSSKSPLNNVYGPNSSVRIFVLEISKVHERVDGRLEPVLGNLSGG